VRSRNAAARVPPRGIFTDNQGLYGPYSGYVFCPFLLNLRFCVREHTCLTKHVHSLQEFNFETG
jgi:hypothetical protein